MHRTWQELETHYLSAIICAPNFADMHEAMAGLCEWFKSSNLASGLYAHTSHHTLFIYQVAQEYPPHHSAQKLEVSPNFETGKIDFRLLDTPVEEKQWSRTENPNTQALVDRIIGFTKQVGWTNGH